MRSIIDLPILNTYYLVVPPLQNGDQSFYQSFDSSKYVDHFPGSFRRLFPYSYLPFIPQIPSFCLEQQSLPIQSSSIPPVDCTTSFYQRYADSHSSSSFPGYSDSFLSGQKIRPQDFIFLGENSLTQQGLVSESLFESSSVSVSENSYCSPIFTTARSFEFSSGRCSTWSPSHSTTSILSTPALAPSSSELGLSNSDYSSGLVSSSSMVDCSRKRFERPTSVLPSPKSDFVHGCLQSRLWNLSGRSFSLGSMDSRSSEGAHQFPRNEGSSSCTVSFPVPSAEQVSCSCIGQHHSCCIFEESRRNSLLQTTF